MSAGANCLMSTCESVLHACCIGVAPFSLRHWPKRCSALLEGRTFLTISMVGAAGSIRGFVALSIRGSCCCGRKPRVRFVCARLNVGGIPFACFALLREGTPTCRSVQLSSSAEEDSWSCLVASRIDGVCGLIDGFAPMASACGRGPLMWIGESRPVD